MIREALNHCATKNTGTSQCHGGKIKTTVHAKTTHAFSFLKLRAYHYCKSTAYPATIQDGGE